MLETENWLVSVAYLLLRLVKQIDVVCGVAVVQVWPDLAHFGFTRISQSLIFEAEQLTNY